MKAVQCKKCGGVLTVQACRYISLYKHQRNIWCPCNSTYYSIEDGKGVFLGKYKNISIEIED